MDPNHFLTSRGLRSLADTLDELTKARNEKGVDVTAYSHLTVSVHHYASDESPTGNVDVWWHSGRGYVVAVNS